MLPGFLSLTAKAQSTPRDVLRRGTVPEFFYWLHFTLHRLPSPPGLWLGEKGGEGADRAYREGWIDDCRVMIVE